MWKQSRLFLPASCLFLLFFSIPFSSKAGDDPPYDELSVFFSMPHVGGIEIPAVISNNTLYLPLTDVFNFLKIKNSISSGRDSVNGYFMDPLALYLVDYQARRIQYNGKLFDAPEGVFIRTETNLYLRGDYFGKVFGLECTFRLRSLSVLLDTKLDLPVIREMRQEMLYRNLKKIKGEVRADSFIKREYRFFNIGVADWSVTNSNQSNADTRFTMRLGAILAGGEVTATLNYKKDTFLSYKQQNLQWRFVNNNSRACRQVILGNIAPNATTSIFAPILGVQLTNASTQRRRSFGAYRLSDRTDPDGMVELYVNNVLIDYVKADASGLFTFEVPLIYGNTAVKLRFYSTSGEERFSERTIRVPFNFLPRNEIEYTVSAGLVEDSSNSKFARAVFDYGFSRNITLGTGMEYLSSLISGKNMPFAAATFRLTPNVLFSSEYIYGVQFKSSLSYRQFSNLQLEFNYTKYAKGQKAVLNNNLEERKATLSMPLLRAPKTYWLSRFSISQTVAPMIPYETILHTKYSDIPKGKYLTTELTLSGSLANVNANLSTYGMFRKAAPPYIYSNLAWTYPFPHGLIFRPQLQFEYSQTKLMNLKLDLEKRVLNKGIVNISYQRNYSVQSNNITLGFHYNFSFARTAFLASQTDRKTTFVQYASGSLIHDGKTHYTHFGDRSGIGRGGITLVAFLDINCNGKRERNEPEVPGLKFRINGGRVIRTEDESITRVLDLEPYVNYLIELDVNSFSNIAWQIRKKSLSVTIDPNSLKLVEVPVAVVGEASGMVFLQEGTIQKGLSRILVNFYDSSAKVVAQTLTESDGYFNYLGLVPGAYIARVDTAQLRNLKLKSTPETLSFTIASSEEGTVADGFEFRLQSLSETSAQQKDVLQKQLPTLLQKQAANGAQLKENRSGKQGAVIEKKEPPVAINKQHLDTIIMAKEQLGTQHKPPVYARRNDGAKKVIPVNPQSPKKESPAKQHAETRQKHLPVAKNQQHMIVANEAGTRNLKQRLVFELQQLDTREQKALGDIQRLKQEQQQLLREQKRLLKEIQQLKRLLQNRKQAGITN